jgi:hypothetical protein
MIADICGERASPSSLRQSRRGYFLPACFPTNYFAAKPNKQAEVAHEISRGLQRHFEKYFYESVISKSSVVDSSSVSGIRADNNSIRGKLVAYLGNMNPRVKIWLMVLHLIRFGRLDIAVIELKQCKAEGVEADGIIDAVIILLQFYIRMSTASSSSSLLLNTDEQQEFCAALRLCKAAFTSEDISVSNQPSSYRKSVLNLLTNFEFKDGATAANCCYI